jgi:hypothetical protein
MPFIAPQIHGRKTNFGMTKLGKAARQNKYYFQLFAWLGGGIEPCNNPLTHKDFSLLARLLDSTLIPKPPPPPSPRFKTAIAGRIKNDMDAAKRSTLRTRPWQKRLMRWRLGAMIFSIPM